MLVNKPKPPYVYIVGAGPGDPALLTLKTYELISKIADTVIYDRLISDKILDLIPKNIEKIYAGKSCKKHFMTQDEINQALVLEAKKGKVVVRLKGGDPFIFGRGAEEAEYLAQNSVPFEIVPGVNAADGCSAYRNIPLTHRGLATGVRFITGHQQKGQPANLNWQSLACPNTTLVIYMGLTNLQEIAHKLIENGLSPSTPVAAIENGTTQEERFCISDLRNIYNDISKQQFKPPTLIIVGKVVSLAKTTR